MSKEHPIWITYSNAGADKTILVQVTIPGESHLFFCDTEAQVRDAIERCASILRQKGYAPFKYDLRKKGKLERVFV